MWSGLRLNRGRTARHKGAVLAGRQREGRGKVTCVTPKYGLSLTMHGRCDADPHEEEKEEEVSRTDG
jgi:hypothetical protein